MNPADLQAGDTVMARHSKPRGENLPLITETHMVVGKVYPKDRLVVGRVTRRFVYVEGSPTLGQAVPLTHEGEAFDFGDLVMVLATEHSKAAPPVTPPVAPARLPLGAAQAERAPWDNLPPFLGGVRAPVVSDLIDYLQQQPNVRVVLSEEDIQAPGDYVDLGTALRQIQERIEQEATSEEAAAAQHSDRPKA